ncbi:transposable element Tcb2 transposase [Trichonephila clavipes]|nr:transposable element Tcb2 transposase [Trichonephila clavipes]
MEPGRFKDESRFNLSRDDNRVRVWRTRGEHLNPAFAFQRHTPPTAGVMPHTARVSQDCLRTVTTLSTDLSPIEYIWDHLGRRVGHPTSFIELEARLQQIWNEMSQDIIQNLYASMPDRIASCLCATWGSTRKYSMYKKLNPHFTKEFMLHQYYYGPQGKEKCESVFRFCRISGKNDDELVAATFSETIYFPHFRSLIFAVGGLDDKRG